MGLEKLLYLQGVGASYSDYSGRLVHHSQAERLRLLACLLANCTQPKFHLDDLSPDGFVAANGEAIEKRNFDLDVAPWQRPLAIFQFACLTEPSFTLSLPAEMQRDLRVRILTEGGTQLEMSIPFAALERVGDYYCEPHLYYRYRVSIAPYLTQGQSLPMGYHKLSVGFCKGTLDGKSKLNTMAIDWQTEGHHGTWLLAPPKAKQLRETDKPWGVSIALYSLRSDSQWGIGDFGDLGALIAWLGDYGCDFIQLNPLHALGDSFNLEEAYISPYSPSDRRRLNPLYIHIESVPEANEIAPLLQTLALDRERLNRDNWLDYPKLTQLKYRLFIALYQVFSRDVLGSGGPREQAFMQFVAQEGEALSSFCQLEADKAQAQGEQMAADPQLHSYLQFVAHEQLIACQHQALAAGMSIGLIGDMAVGVRGDGAEVHHNRDAYCQQASIGAPPDDFAPKGQNWGLTPPDPIAMAQSGFSHFIALVRSNMRYYGAIRLDHVMALLRLWWWPSEPQEAPGAYVYYPIDTLLAIVRLESMRSNCVVIGEDLGIVPDEVRAKLSDGGIYANELFYFCKKGESFKSPQDHRADSLMMLANHDVPTLLAWWSQSDLHLKRQLELLESDQALEQALERRDGERQQLLAWLEANGETASLEEDYLLLLSAWVTVAARSHSRLFSVQLADLCCERHGVNIPGTWQEYANWQRRLPYSLTSLRQSPSIKRLLRSIVEGRSSAEASEQFCRADERLRQPVFSR
ncbi:4-alpha-glucanotransferase [Shewanella spartinae]|uniref:4-alpha-glucanotransferase n=1 Tax=Shewanella spartinae TaxID=2864205 RepID=UPI001C65DD76|nr:4-alpha-glucanotransferase [Shewanella spartinae]QYJ94923.1 4-alpha-glucanotransferase [Shewanella spartinae]